MKNIAVVSMLISALLWSTYPVAATLASKGLSFFWGFLIGATVSVIFYLALAFFKNIPLHIRALFLCKTCVLNLLLAAALLSTGSLAFFYALVNYSPIFSTILLEAWPVLAAVISPLVIPNKIWRSTPASSWFFAGLAFIGVGLLTIDPSRLSSAILKSSIISVILPIYGAACFAIAGLIQSKLSTIVSERIGDNEDKFISVINIRIFTDLAVSLLTILYTPFLINIGLVSPISEIGFTGLAPAIYLGIVVYGVAGFFFTYSYTHSDDRMVGIIATLAPVGAVVWLAMLGLDSFSKTAFLGILIVVSSNIALASRNRYHSSITYSIFAGFSAAIFIIVTGDSMIINLTPTIEIVGLIFAIILGFSLERSSTYMKNRDELRTGLVVCCKRMLIIAKRDKRVKEKELAALLDELLITILDIEHSETSIEFDDALKRLWDLHGKIHSLTDISDHQENWDEYISKLVELSADWINAKTHTISISEKYIILLLGMSTIIGILIDRSTSNVADVISIVAVTGISFLLGELHDYSINRPGRSFGSLNVVQDAFREIGKTLYIPPKIIAKGQMPSPNKPIYVRTVNGENHNLETIKVSPDPIWLTLSLRIITIIVGILVIGLILFNK
jgi:drug/metabolite transporter (DMT)-like permease